MRAATPTIFDTKEQNSKGFPLFWKITNRRWELLNLFTII